MSLAAGLGTTVTPSVTVMHVPLNPMVSTNLIRTVVDTWVINEQHQFAAEAAP